MAGEVPGCLSRVSEPDLVHTQGQHSVARVPQDSPAHRDSGNYYLGFRGYSPPKVDRIWLWVYYNKIHIYPIFYLLKGGYRLHGSRLQED